LKETGNCRAHLLLETCRDASSTQGNIFDLLKNQIEQSPDGRYEGISHDEELNANKVVDYIKTGTIAFDSKSKITATTWRRRGKLDAIVSKFIRAVENQHVWWNPLKSNLPRYFIDRKVCSTKEIGLQSKETFELIELMQTQFSKVEYDWKKWNDRGLIFLVDPPGMGKSCAVTKLEMEMRNRPSEPHRIIVRVDLNKVSSVFSEDVLDLIGFLRRFAPYIPIDTLLFQKRHLPVFILLDGLDEVLPHYKEVMLSILNIILSSPNSPLEKSQDKIFLAKLLLTSRPHLKELIENEFQVAAVSLLPISSKEQVEYLHVEINRIILDSNEKNKTMKSVIRRLVFPMPISKPALFQMCEKEFSSVQDLLSNPLMLKLYAEIISAHIIKESRQLVFTEMDRYQLYLGFVTKKHELHVLEKTSKSIAAIETQRMLRNMLESNERFYYFLAVKELLSEEECNRIVNIDSIGKIRKLEEPSSDDITKLLSYGLIMKEDENTRFKHRSFAEFFYARLMADINGTLYKLRDALYVLGYKSGENIANFVAGALNSTDVLESLSTVIQVQVVWEQKSESIEYSSNQSKQLLREWLSAAVNETTNDKMCGTLYKLFKTISSGPASSLLYQIMTEQNIHDRRALTDCTLEETTSVKDFVIFWVKKETSRFLKELIQEKDTILENFGIDWLLNNISACWMMIDIFSRE